jgi:NAD+ kinase
VRNIGIIVHDNPALVREPLRRVIAKLGEIFPTAKLHLTAKAASFEQPEGCHVTPLLMELARSSEIIISIGGDGTMLLAASAIARANPSARLIGVNAGKLGFLSEHPPEEIDALFQELANHTLVREERLMLKSIVRSESGEAVHIKHDNLDVSRNDSRVAEATFDVLNEVVIDNFGSTRMLTFEVYVGNSLMGVIRADGIMISTPTGSTGYSVSAGGPIIEPSSRVMLITAIAPHSLNVRPIIVPEDAVVRIRTVKEDHHETLIVADGQEQFVVAAPAEVTVRAAENRLHLLRRNERSYFDLLRTKLFWSADRRDFGKR